MSPFCAGRSPVWKRKPAATGIKLGVARVPNFRFDLAVFVNKLCQTDHFRFFGRSGWPQ